MSKKITTGNQLELFLQLLVKESMEKAQEELENLSENAIPHLREQEEVEEEEEVEVEEEEAPPEEEVKVKVKDEEGGEKVEVDVEEKDPMKRGPRREPKRPETGSEVTLQTILGDINQIRSGKSLKDPEVRGNLDDYFKGLSNPERMALSEFLEGLTDVIVKGMPADQAEDPSDEVTIEEPGAEATEEVESETETEEVVAEKPAENLTPPIQVRR
jgi:hypothetical protein